MHKHKQFSARRNLGKSHRTAAQAAEEGAIAPEAPPNTEPNACDPMPLVCPNEPSPDGLPKAAWPDRAAAPPPKAGPDRAAAGGAFCPLLPNAENRLRRSQRQAPHAFVNRLFNNPVLLVVRPGNYGPHFEKCNCSGKKPGRLLSPEGT